MDSVPAFLTMQETADLFGVDPKTARRWVRDGRLSSIRTPGGRLRVPAADVYTKLASGDAQCHE